MAHSVRGSNPLPARFPLEALEDERQLSRLIAQITMAPVSMFGRSTVTDPMVRERERQNTIGFLRGALRVRERQSRHQILLAAGNRVGVCRFPGCNGEPLTPEKPGWCRGCTNKVHAFWDFKQRRPSDEGFIMTSPSLCRHPTCAAARLKWTGRGQLECGSCRVWADLISAGEGPEPEGEFEFESGWDEDDADDETGGQGEGRRARALRGIKRVGSFLTGSSRR